LTTGDLEGGGNLEKQKVAQGGAGGLAKKGSQVVVVAF